jgi:hypothetical protein
MAKLLQTESPTLFDDYTARAQGAGATFLRSWTDCNIESRSSEHAIPAEARVTACSNLRFGYVAVPADHSAFA